MNRNNEPDTNAILRKMQNQLDCMERKIDSLVKQAFPRDFKSNYPSSPRREFDDKKRSFKGKHAQRKEGEKSTKGFYSDIASGKKKPSSKRSFRNKTKEQKGPSPIRNKEIKG